MSGLKIVQLGRRGAKELDVIIPKGGDLSAKEKGWRGLKKKFEGAKTRGFRREGVEKESCSEATAPVVEEMAGIVGSLKVEEVTQGDQWVEEEDKRTDGRDAKRKEREGEREGARTHLSSNKI